MRGGGFIERSKASNLAVDASVGDGKKDVMSGPGGLITGDILRPVNLVSFNRIHD